jgi:ADP-heptose:LPS heptosyltransferase
LFYRFKKIPTFKINKGRREKKAQIRRNKKILTPLPHSVERYLKVFEKAGFPAKVRRGPWINVDPESKIFASEFFKSSNLKKKDGLWIGFAPFAGHQLKEWPFYKSINLIKILKTEFPGCEIFLFGSNEEIEKLKYLKKDNDNCHIVVGGDLGIQGEIGVMEKLDLLIGMDSSNIHIMALLKKPVIAIFGTTHPYSGFSPFGQEDTGVLQVDLPCRPCSIYGNTTCWRKDFACMEMIDPMDVAKRIKLIQNINTLW